MTEPPRDLPPRAAAALAKRRAHIHLLRARVAVVAVSVFVAAWATVFVRLVEGHAPALASTPATVVSQSADPDVTDDEPTTSSDSSGTSTAAPSAVTTRQS